MKKTALATLAILIGSFGVKAQTPDTLFFQDFNDWPYYLEAIDSVFTTFDEDQITDFNGLPGNWFVGNLGNGGADSAEICAVSSSWLSGFAPGNRNWLVLPGFHLADNTGVLRWKSAPALGNLYLDGYTVAISNNPDFYYDPTFSEADTLAHFAQNMNDNENDFSAGTMHTNLDMNAPINVASVTQYPGLLTEWEVDLSAYAGQTVYIGFLHNSDDDNYIALDDILLFGNGGMVGLSENKLESTDVQLYPNPANEQINLTFDFEALQNITIQIYNAAGQLVQTENLNGTKGTNKQNINIQNLNTGIYFLHLQSGETTITKHLIKK